MPSPPSLRAPVSRKALAGFLISGLLLSMPGAILLSWGYHLRSHFLAIGNYFLFVNFGLLLSIPAGRRILKRGTISAALVSGCLLAAVSLSALAFAAPPVAEWWRLPGFLGLGVAAGLLHSAVFHSIAGAYRRSPVLTVNLAGTIFGAGSGLGVLLIAESFDVYSAESVLLLLATVPALAGIWFSRIRLPDTVEIGERSSAELRREFLSPGAILFSTLLFFQFGNEWAVSGWLPLFLVQRLGISPEAALLLLALYWSALVAGRLLTQVILAFIPHGRLLAGSVLASIFGCVLLAFTNNLFGAGLGVLFIGLGFAPVYPLVVEKIGARFPNYYPGVYNGVFSLALTGGMAAPATLGYVAEQFGLRVVMVLPMVGSIVVFFLLLLIWLESKLTGAGSAKL